MRDPRDRSRSPPAGPFRYRLQRPAALPHARRAAQRRRALRQERARPTMTCETTGDENALSDSGPLRPALEEEVMRCDVRVSSVSGAVGYGSTNLYRLSGPEQRLGGLIGGGDGW